MSLPTAQLRPLIAAAATTAVLPPWRGFLPGEWLEGLVMTESSGNPRARRYESHQDRAGRRDQREDADQPDHDDGPLEDDASYGLAQVMGYNLRRYVGAPPGTPLNFAFGYRPILNLDAGIWVLEGELRALKAEGAVALLVERALARYNGGPTGDDLQPDGSIRLQAYVNRVLRWTEKVRAETR